jgi:septal ring factor EnvC (AmiA/AmiB activator)
LKEATTTLTAMRQELEAKQAALSGLDSAESSLVTSLGELDETLARLDDDRRAGAAQLLALQTEIAALERDAGVDEAELARLRARLQARLKALVVDGEGGVARALLGAEGFTELALRRRYLGALADTDAKLVKDVRRVEVSALQKRDMLRSRLSEAAMVQKLIDEQRHNTLERIRGERLVLRRAATELSARHRDLQNLVAKLAEGPRYKPPTGRSGMLRRGMAWPVFGARLIRRFGSVKDQATGAEIVSNGVELRAEAGSPVVAVADGRVVHTGWLRGFGRIVIVDHGEGHHTLSAHLERAAVGRGDEVQAGQTIGFVGDTESQNGPKLYFELRENGRPRDPLPFLKGQ